MATIPARAEASGSTAFDAQISSLRGKMAEANAAAHRQRQKMTVASVLEYNRYKKQAKPLPAAVVSYPPPAPAQPETLLSSSNMRLWPLGMREYVGRAVDAMEKLEDSASKRYAREQLERVLRTAFEDRKVFQDWSLVPLPPACVGKKAVSLTPDYIPLDSTPPPAKKRKRGLDAMAALEQKALNAAERKKSQRSQRFTQRLPPRPASQPLSETAAEEEWMSASPLVGTSEKLERPYLRLTRPALAEEVRPLRVLRNSLDLVLQVFNEKRDYIYIFEQLESIRQDVLVSHHLSPITLLNFILMCDHSHSLFSQIQHIRNDFTVTVYECHARLALQHADWGEFHQCQTQLMELYESGIDGNVMEFSAYRLLYFIYSDNFADFGRLMHSLGAEKRKHPFIAHAIQVMSLLSCPLLSSPVLTSSNQQQQRRNKSLNNTEQKRKFPKSLLPDTSDKATARRGTGRDRSMPVLAASEFISSA